MTLASNRKVTPDAGGNRLKNDRNTRFVSLSAVNNVAKALTEKPVLEQETFSLRAAIEKLYPHIVAMREKGYSWESIIEALKKEDIDIKITTLRTYIYELNGNLAKTNSGKAGR